ncbi:MAG: hypothetical protein Ct9H90mP13_03710 [Pseudomonadota bacterium]|nr:MAG: hypothetical protein Ct9H90mP13_03710 [Pseudomonadota bacterium]
MSIRSVLKALRGKAVEIKIHGHTHRPNVHKISNDQKKLTRYVLGDWIKRVPSY